MQPARLTMCVRVRERQNWCCGFLGHQTCPRVRSRFFVSEWKRTERAGEVFAAVVTSVCVWRRSTSLPYVSCSHNLAKMWIQLLQDITVRCILPILPSKFNKLIKITLYGDIKYQLCHGLRCVIPMHHRTPQHPSASMLSECLDIKLKKHRTFRSYQLRDAVLGFSFALKRADRIPNTYTGYLLCDFNPHHVLFPFVEIHSIAYVFAATVAEGHSFTDLP